MTTTFKTTCLVALIASQAMAFDYYGIGGPTQVRGTFGGPPETLKASQDLAGALAVLVNREHDGIAALNAQGKFLLLGTTTMTVNFTVAQTSHFQDLALADDTYFGLTSSGISAYEPTDGTEVPLVGASLLPTSAKDLAARHLPSGARALWVASSTEVRRLVSPLQGGGFVSWAASLPVRDVAVATTGQGDEVTLILTSTEVRVYQDDEAEVWFRGSIPIADGKTIAGSRTECQGGRCVAGLVVTNPGNLLTLDLDAMTAQPGGTGLPPGTHPMLSWGMAAQKMAVGATDETGDPHTARVQLISPLNGGPGWDLPGHSGQNVDVGDVYGSDPGGPGDGTTEILTSDYSFSGTNQRADYLSIWNIDGSGALVKVASAQPYGTSAYGGTVAAGNIIFTPGDATQGDEVLTGPGPGPNNAPQVRAFDASNGTLSPIPAVDFYAYGTLRYGVNVSAHGGAPAPNFLTLAGNGTIYGPHVRGYTMASGQLQPIPAKNFYAYSTLRYGVNGDEGDFDRNECDDIVTGPGPGIVFSPHIRGFSWNWGPLKTIPEINFFLTDAQGNGAKYGARVAWIDTNPTPKYELAGSIGPDPNDAGPNARLIGLRQPPTKTEDKSQGWNCQKCNLYLGSNQR